MALKARPPKEQNKRLNILIWGEAGTGKTTFGCNWPNSYLCDHEKGMDFYHELINSMKSAVSTPATFDDLLDEVRSLRSEKHEYRTLVIDPITQMFHELVDNLKDEVGTDFGAHYTEAGRCMSELQKILMQLDMNVILTAHGKQEYGEGMTKLGFTWDCWKKHIFYADLGLRLELRPGGKRVAVVKKTRLTEQFPTGDVFEWSYDEFIKRYGSKMAAPSVAADMATPEMVEELNALVQSVRLPDGQVKKWLAAAKVPELADLTKEQIESCIKLCKKKVSGKAKA